MKWTSQGSRVIQASNALPESIFSLKSLDMKATTHFSWCVRSLFSQKPNCAVTHFQPEQRSFLVLRNLRCVTHLPTRTAKVPCSAVFPAESHHLKICLLHFELCICLHIGFFATIGASSSKQFAAVASNPLFHLLRNHVLFLAMLIIYRILRKYFAVTNSRKVSMRYATL